MTKKLLGFGFMRLPKLDDAIDIEQVKEKYHIQNAKDHGVSQKEMAAAITHVAFYAGWPKAWAVFNLAKEVYSEWGKPVLEEEYNGLK